MKYLVCLAIHIIALSAGLSAPAHAETSYRLGPGDVINIHVYGESDLSMEVLINNSGVIDYPYLGRLAVTGNTTHKLKDEIENGLRGDYLIHPKVAVNIVSYRQIFINGEVQNPGGYAYQPGLTVEKAVALAGGFTQRAAKSNIGLTPSGGGAEDKVALGAKVEPGDIIIVKASFF